jgi:Domain of unknown function DUF29
MLPLSGSMRPMSNTLYQRDFYAWANEQAALLRAGKLGDADIENIAEEIESMGRSEKRELVSRLTVLLMHLLKWQYQPERRGKSWRITIEQQRDQLQDHLNDNPSLRSLLPPSIRTAYRDARREAEKETDLDRDTLPAECPYTFDQMMAEDFWPA